MNIVREEMIEGSCGFARVKLHETGKQSATVVTLGRATTFSIEVSLSNPVMCRVCGRSSSWRFDDEMPEPLRELRVWVMRELWDAEGPQGEDPRQEIAYRRITEVARIVEERVGATIDRRAADLVDGLEPAAAFATYAALLADPTGRIAQAIDICPNLFALAHGTRAWSRVVRGVRCGRKLGPLIAYVLREHLGEIEARDQGLVRHLPPLPAMQLIELLSAPGMCLDDLLAARDREGWATFMIGWARRAKRIDDAFDAERLGAFFSRYAVELDDQLWSCDEIVDALDAAGLRYPTRGSSCRAIVKRIDGWQQRTSLAALGPDTPMAPGPRGAHEGVDATQLATLGALQLEGFEMGNCVAQLAIAALEGISFFYRASVRGTRATIEVRRAVAGWQLHQLALAENGEPSLDHNQLVHAWVATLR